MRLVEGRYVCLREKQEWAWSRSERAVERSERAVRSIKGAVEESEKAGVGKGGENSLK